MAKPPEYRLSAPNTGSYRLSPQAAPVSTYVRPKQINPNVTDFKAQVDSFQNFVKSMADWRATENRDNQERAQLRALADNARGELDANLENEDEDYQKYGRFLQGKNYGKQIGSKLIAEITTGSEGQMGLMDQAFAQSKLPENHNRKVEDIFSEMLEERKDFYRDQVPDSSDEFYSGFGEAMQPFASEINKSFYERIQKETFNGRRENFSVTFRLQLETDIRSGRSEFDQTYLRNRSSEISRVTGLSEDAALGESIRILNSEIAQMIASADSEEDLELAENMLSVFDTASKGRARLIDIPIFKEDAQRAYTSLGGAIDKQRRALEVKEKQEEDDLRFKQERTLIETIITQKGAITLDQINKLGPNLSAEDIREAVNFAESVKTRNKNIVYNRKVFGDNLVLARKGALSYDKAKQLFENKEISEPNFKELLNSIDKSKKYDTRAFQLFENRIVQNLNPTPPGFDLKTLEITDPQAYTAIQDNLLDLQTVIIDVAEELLEGNQTNLNISRQLELLDQVRKNDRVQEAVKNYNDFIKLTFGDTKQSRVVSDEESSEQTKEQIIQNKYFGPEATYENLYEDYLQLSLAIRGKLKGGSDRLGDTNAFKGMTLSEARTKLVELKKGLKQEPPMGINEWIRRRILKADRSFWGMNNALHEAYKTLWELSTIGRGEKLPELSMAEKFLGPAADLLPDWDSKPSKSDTTTQSRKSARR